MVRVSKFECVGGPVDGAFFWGTEEGQELIIDHQGHDHLYVLCNEQYWYHGDLSDLQNGVHPFEE